jgi:hypothetical protein
VWKFALAAAATVCLWAAPMAGADTVVVGSTGGGFPGGGGYINFNTTISITVANLTLGEDGAHAASPVNGTITQWRVNAGDTGAYDLHVLRPVGGDQFMEAGSSPGNVTTSGVNTFSASLPIQIGDILGVDVPPESSVVGSFGFPGSSQTAFSPAFTSGETQSLDSTPDTEQETFLNADVQYTPSSGAAPPPALPAAPAKKKKCKKKKHKRAAAAAKKKCKKKKK